MDNFENILSVDKTAISQRQVFPKRKARILEALSWPKGTDIRKIYTAIWEKGDYKVALGKPGKEALPGYRGKPNPDDMKPMIFYKGNEVTKPATFQEIVKSLEKISKEHPFELELLGSLLFRAAFLLDHKKVGRENNNDIFRYFPNEEVLARINKSVSSIDGLPVEVLVHYLDAIALNEDVKYYSKGYDLEKKSTGGKNNLLTYVNLIVVMTGKKSLYEIASLLRSDVAAISLKSAFETLPYISKK